MWQGLVTGYTFLNPSVSFGSILKVFAWILGLLGSVGHHGCELEYEELFLAIQGDRVKIKDVLAQKQFLAQNFDAGLAVIVKLVRKLFFAKF